ncbi:MAG: 4'-phosphopantetheinyl transferase superfamily protein [Azospirillaceae bacterium]|nr:4'-phosphopantetheinyl transferase superfamily protein [Azospirillaceae bacterium]
MREVSPLVLRTLSLAEVDATVYDRLWRLLNGEEQARAERFVFERNRREFVAAHGLTRLLLGRLAGRDPAALSFAPITPQGKPGLVDAPPALDFNLSHTDGLVACAVTLAPGARVGLDVEDGARDVGADIATHMFSADELAWLDGRPGGRDGPDLMTFWTLKEAYIKALGMGLSLPTDSFSILPAAASGDWTLVRHDGSLAVGQGCRFWCRDLPSGHKLALAVVAPEDQLPADPVMGEGLADLW